MTKLGTIIISITMSMTMSMSISMTIISNYKFKLDAKIILKEL